MTIGERIKNMRLKYGLTQDDLASRIHTTKQTIHKYENGIITNIPSSKIMAIANVLNTTPDYLMGWVNDENGKTTDAMSVKGVMPLPRTKRRPRLGVIACGEPILAQENIEDYDEVPEDMQCDFTLICQGDSMTGARINDGDIVYIKEQPIVDNGEIAACRVDGEFDSHATLKRFFKYDDRVVLQSENPQYPPFVYIKEEMNKVHILGKAVGFTSKL